MLDILTYVLFAMYLSISVVMISGWCLLAWRPRPARGVGLESGELKATNGG